ncbi:hypothetical protein CDAR_474341 [Caerostris darwini]|uniref:Uncharacterized protein n=1 Tax=Caerostris darwini TaxID=1538125 RepID=A0AAV4M3Z0_9ARAC|nr:hypothetical protein CDAR_474341 [Caerostris darwini]
MICKSNEGEEGLPLIHEHSKTPLRKIEAASHQRGMGTTEAASTATHRCRKEKGLKMVRNSQMALFAFLKRGWRCKKKKNADVYCIEPIRDGGGVGPNVGAERELIH